MDTGEKVKGRKWGRLWVLFFFHSSIEREAALLYINHSGLSWDLCLFGARLNRKTRHLSHCTFHQTAWQEIQVLHLLTPPPHAFPATHGSHVLDTMAHKRSSHSASLIIPSSAVPSHQRALEVEEESGHSAVCPSKVHIWMRWWTAAEQL